MLTKKNKRMVRKMKNTSRHSHLQKKKLTK